MFRIDIESDFHLELLHLHHSTQLFALVQQNRTRLREWLPWLDKNRTEEDTKDFINSSMELYGKGTGFQVALLFKNRIVGITGFHPINPFNRSTTLGYWLDKDHEGLGLMIKANSTVIDIGFSHFDLNKIVIYCAIENRKSRRLAEKLGFKLDGIMRENEWLYDHFVDNAVYSLLKSEHLSSQL